MAVAVGIDLGTTNTVVAAVRDGVAGTIADPQGHRLIPSVVSFHPGGSTLVGHAALDRRLVDAPNTIYSTKRLVGRPWSSAEVQQARDKLPFEVREGATGGTVVCARGETYSLPEVSAFILRHAKAIAEAALGEPAERAVVTVPANFNDLQREATKTAGRIAGLDVLRILNEPTAAALAYGPPQKVQERIAVYDLGGGTFDVTLLDLAGNVFEVLSTSGDTALGGDDIDLVIVERMSADLLAKFRFDARAQPGSFARLRILAEGLKRELSTHEEYSVSVDDLVPGERGRSVAWTFRMTRPELEWASLALVERTFAVCQQALESAGLRQADLERVILVGGATRMPLVARKVEQFFGRPPVVRINPDEVVALGASIQASLLDRSRRRTAHAAEHPRISPESVVQPLPAEEAASAEGLPLPIVGPTRTADPKAPSEFLPGVTPRALVFDLPGAAPAVSPDSSPPESRKGAPAPPPLPSRAAPPNRALRVDGPPGAPPSLPPQRPRAPTLALPSAQASPPAPSVPSTAPRAVSRLPPRAAPLLIDVTPLSLSVETVGGFCDVLIEANTPVPCDRTRSFATASDGQTAVNVRVAQGVSKRFAENTCLGELELSGITPAPRGQTQIAVTFEIDADGILNVRARDVMTGRETNATIQLVGAQTSPEDIERMRARQAEHPISA